MSDKVCAMTVTDAKIKKALPPQKKKKLTGVCCERRLNQVVTSTHSFPKSGLQIDISRTRTDKNRENQQRLAYSYFRLSLFLSFLFPHCPEQSTNRNWKFAFFSMVECRRVKFPANTVIERILEDTSVKCYWDFDYFDFSAIQALSVFCLFVFFSSSFLYLSTHTVW